MASGLQPKVFLAGRVSVETNGVVVDEARFPGRQGRLLFAYLVAEQGRPVPRDELAELLWRETPPASWDKALTGIVSKVRILLGEQGIDGAKALTGAFGCYRLELPDGTWVDVAVAAEAAREAEAALAADDLAKAKDAGALAASLLRQPFLPGEEGAWVEEKRRELEGVRERALDVLADASLRSGDASGAVRWAEQVVALAPFRESGYRRLMAAHVAAGNRAEALRVYERCRRLLADELGAYPSPETESIYRSVLAAPAAPPDAPSEAVPIEPRERGDGGHRRILALAAVAVIAAAGAATVFALLGVRGSPATHPVASDSLGIVDPASGHVRADVAVGATPTGVAVGEGAYWITNANADTVSRIDPATGAIVQTIPVGNSPSGITTGAGAVWVANSLDGTVSRIDPATNTVVQTIDVGNGPLGIAYAAGSVWVANSGDGTIARIDGESGTRMKTLPVPATDLAVGDGSLWASLRAASQVARIDLPSDDVQLIGVGGGPTGIAFGSGAVWVANSLDGTVSRIDPSTNSVAATIPAVGDGPSGVAVDDHGVWVSNQFDGTLARIDPRKNSVTRRIRVGDRLQGVATTGGSVLVNVDTQAGAGHRGGNLTVRMNRNLDSIDPAVSYDTTSIPILRMTNDGLVAFNQASGLAGTQLVPDLAVSLPTPTDAGQTYSFRLRPNIRYSNGSTVKASDIRRAFERDYKIGKLPVDYYDVIVGADRCVRHRRCDLSRGIVANDSARTVTFHLVAPDPDFLDQLALEFAYAVPSGAPAREMSSPLPATGPYMIRSYRPGRVLTLVRNPYFHEWSRAAQPDGYPDSIVFRIGGTPDGAVRDVLAGKADAFSTSQSENPPSAAILDMLTLRYASQVHTSPQQATIALFLNTHLAPFDRLDVRRALNFAADRAAAVRISGGSEVARPTCQILPPHFPGYRPYCPYTVHASTGGVWAAPDLAKARALVGRSGTRGMKITVWSWGDLAGLGPYTTRLLRSLGYRVAMKTVRGNHYFAVAFDSRNKPQIGTAEWITDYPTAAGFFNPLFTCASFQPRSSNNVNGAEFCDPRLDRKISRAVAEQTTNPDAARRLWAQIDRSTVDAAPWVPLVNPSVVDVLSKRVGNYQYSPAGWGMLIDQLWVRSSGPSKKN